MPTCSNCERPQTRLAARGLCSRCYRYESRNGSLPPPALLIAEAGDGAEGQIVVRCDSSLRRRAERAAHATGLTLAAWVRAAIAAHLP